MEEFYSILNGITIWFNSLIPQDKLLMLVVTISFSTIIFFELCCRKVVNKAENGFYPEREEVSKLKNAVRNLVVTNGSNI